MPIPISDTEYERLAVVVSNKTGHTLIDPRFASPSITSFVHDFQIEQQHWLDQVRTYFRLPARVLFGISSEPARQAYALNDGLGPIIILSFGLTTTLQVYFSGLLCNPSSFSDIGDVSSELWPRLPQGDQWNIIPLDPVRRWVSGVLTRIAMRFIVAHELTHIEQGHLSLLALTDSASRLDEATTLREEVTALRRQAIEIAADQGAIKILMGDPSVWNLFEGCQPPQDQTISPSFLERMWLYSIFTTFRLLDSGRTHPPIASASHPRPVFRVRNIYQFLVSLLVLNSNEAMLDESARVFAETIRAARRDFTDLGVPEVNPESLKESAGFPFPAYATLLNREWAELRTGLLAVSARPDELHDPLINLDGYEISTEKVNSFLREKPPIGEA